MPVSFAMSLMSGIEFLLWTAAGVLFWTKGLHRRFPAMSKYLALRAGSTPLLLGLLYLQAQPWVRGEILGPVYFYSYWAVYVASAVALFLVTVEIFRTMLSAFSGLARLGTVVFRWVAVVSLIASMATVSYTQVHSSDVLICDVAYALMRSVSVLVLCLLAFLCLSMNVLRVSARDRVFGIALGFGVMTANDFVVGTLMSRYESLTSPLQFLNEAVILVSLGIWVTYCALPEPARKPVVMPANSTIYRWNEIASALGHGTQVAVQQTANSFFLTDVERVVEKVLNRNLQGNESKS